MSVCREHSIPSPLGRMVGKSSIRDAELRALVRKAREVGVVVFLQAEIDRLPDMTRAVIESEHKRLCRAADDEP